MARTVSRAKRHGRISAALACASAAALILGSTGIALAAVDRAGPTLGAGFAAFTPASLNPRLAQFLGARDDTGGLMRFTPAGAVARTGRSVTVAVRIDDAAARLIQVRSALAAAGDEVGASAPVEVASTRYDLGIARGYQSFAQAKPAVAAAPARISDIQMPDLAEYRPSPGPRGKPSRFSARLALDKDPKTGRAPNTLDSLGDQTVDLGGAVRVMRNLDVTAGVRYSQDRDRIDPVTEGEKQDSQAVYVGTQLRF